MGKGDTYRSVDRKKYDESYDRIFGIKCPRCFGHGEVVEKLGKATECPQCLGSGVFAAKKCNTCKGSGKIERTK